LGSAFFGWFEEEMISPQQAQAAIAGAACDVMLTHDAPMAMLPYLFPDAWRVETHPEADANIRLVQAVMKATTPSLLLHGHWHKYAHARLALASDGDNDGPGETEVYGLDCNRAPSNAFGILELPSLTFTPEAEIGQGASRS
jgi:hypothetical protein